MFHIWSGSLHHIENLGDTPAELLVVFSDESPVDFSLHGSSGAMSDAVLGNAYGLPAADLAKLRRDPAVASTPATSVIAPPPRRC
jgi:oxalate decarboxylase